MVNVKYITIENICLVKISISVSIHDFTHIGEELIYIYKGLMQSMCINPFII